MARLVQGTALPSPVIRQGDPLIELTRLLGRLQQTVLRADAERERRLRTNEYERRRVESNIQHAQTLLRRIEQDAATAKLFPPRQESHTDLATKRELLEQITDRLRDLKEWKGDVEDDSSDGEDILGEIIPTPSESMDSQSADAAPGDIDDSFDAGHSAPLSGKDTIQEVPRLPEPQASETAPEVSQTTTTQTTLRSRGSAPEKQDLKENGTAKTSSALFGDRRETGLSTTTMTEAILDTQRAEQDVLSESILNIARNLKESSQAFAAALEQDADVVNGASKGLDKNETGLEAAARRMGTLRKMTEGKGWWGRMMLYAWIYGLMVVLVLVVFVLPKLRF